MLATYSSIVRPIKNSICTIDCESATTISCKKVRVGNHMYFVLVRTASFFP